MNHSNITWYSPQQLEAMRNEALINHQLAESKKVLKRVPGEPALHPPFELVSNPYKLPEKDQAR